MFLCLTPQIDFSLQGFLRLCQSTPYVTNFLQNTVMILLSSESRKKSFPFIIELLLYSSVLAYIPVHTALPLLVTDHRLCTVSKKLQVALPCLVLPCLPFLSLPCPTPLYFTRLYPSLLVFKLLN